MDEATVATAEAMVVEDMEEEDTVEVSKTF